MASVNNKFTDGRLTWYSHVEEARRVSCFHRVLGSYERLFNINEDHGMASSADEGRRQMGWRGCWEANLLFQSRGMIKLLLFGELL